jgi:alpha-tubulin suppressor-like RCC1 family protein
VTQIAAGSGDSLAVTSTGQLYAFGTNYHGQLGSATNSGKTLPNPTPTQVSLPGETGTISQIAAGGNHSLVLTSSGQLYAFGDNY